ncbi:MAG: molybdenum cofactor guanylyltransferase [Nitrospirae bacterium]|nr:molybdenum cofactor guanylyltransferase [Nitrospirota bacterium]
MNRLLQQIKMTMTGTILAGGENRRIPLLKGQIEINGKRIIETNINLLLRFFDKVIISTNTPERYFYCGMPMIGDLLEQRGPLTGIYSVLTSTQDDSILVVACDMPFIRPEIVSLLITKYASGQGDWDAVIPQFEGRSQPLIGIYSKNVTGIIEDRIKKDQGSIRDMLTELRVLYVKEEEVSAVDPEGRSFVNINTMKDYKKAVNSV